MVPSVPCLPENCQLARA